MKARLGIGLFCVGIMATASAAAEPVRVLVWDERQPAQKTAYDDFLGNAIAAYLAKNPGFRVKSAALNEPEQGLSARSLEETDVLIWWGHQRHAEITSEKGRAIVERIKSGKLSLIALHSAHWSTPFKEAMYERARIDALKSIAEADRNKTFVLEEIFPKPFQAPKRSDPLTPSSTLVATDKEVSIRLIQANCCFPAYRGDGKPSHVRVLIPGHPLAAGLPSQFDIPKTEMYDEPFHVPPADEVVFEETWDKGEKFRSGLVWKIGKGKVVYFRPGHETFPVFKQAETLRILENAVKWLGETEKK